MSANLPAGCTDRDIDVAAGGYDPPEPEPKFDRWEYRLVDVSVYNVRGVYGVRGREAVLLSLGRSGWELICVEDDVAYLKRIHLGGGR